MPKNRRLHFSPRLLFGFVLALDMLACTTVQRWIAPDGPEAQATGVLATHTPAPSWTPQPTHLPGPTRTPRPTQTPLAPGPSPMPSSTLAVALDDLEQFRAAMRPEHAADVEQLAAATRYVIDVTVVSNGEESATLIGSELVRYANRQSFALNEIDLMLWPNGGQQYLSQMTMSTVQVNGQPVTPAWENGGLTARLPLASPLAPGARVDVRADFFAPKPMGVWTIRAWRASA